MSVLRRRLCQRSWKTTRPIIQRGEAGDSIYFIISGDVEVDRPDGTTRLGPGRFFGEVARIDGGR